MSTKRFTIACLLAAIFIAMNSGPAAAASFPLSPYRAQLAEGEHTSQAPADETAVVDTGKKSIGKGVMFSLIIPGTGQLYAGSWLRAVPWLAIEAVGWTLFAGYHAKGQDKTDEFEAFAGTKEAPNHFSYDAYMLREYQIAVNSNYNTEIYTGSLSEWQSETWAERQDYLQPPYGHDINTDDIQQYFEMIGKYFSQFGYGWKDTFDPATLDLTSQDPNYAPWHDEANGFTDDPSTIAFDGNSPWFFEYRDMRGEANDFLDKGNTMMEVVLVNHVLSALDAAFAIRGANSRVESRLGGLDLDYGIKTINGGTARMLTARLPFNLTK
ncbi:hypothetical protein HZB60_05180 [candidate division KSB1 bacterium]|nr:hypothetical protein [candidate division KSB1 bacterium]